MLKCHSLPPLLPGKAFVEESQDLRDVELDVFKVEIILVVLLHFQKVIKLEIKLQKATIASW